MWGGGPVEEAGPDLEGPGLNGGRWSPACRRQQATWRFVFLAVGGIGTQGSQAWAHGDNEKAVTRVQAEKGASREPGTRHASHLHHIRVQALRSLPSPVPCSEAALGAMIPDL